mmetsp:Transcript_36032/g.116353  ORF Transcript_36032/g.116353 Transcript_36032/m.116353 type:complete len:314 (+) Transcript_36032:253-1194(+)
MAPTRSGAPCSRTPPPPASMMRRSCAGGGTTSGAREKVWPTKTPPPRCGRASRCARGAPSQSSPLPHGAVASPAEKSSCASSGSHAPAAADASAQLGFSSHAPAARPARSFSVRLTLTTTTWRQRGSYEEEPTYSPPSRPASSRSSRRTGDSSPPPTTCMTSGAGAAPARPGPATARLGPASLLGPPPRPSSRLCAACPSAVPSSARGDSAARQARAAPDAASCAASRARGCSSTAALLASAPASASAAAVGWRSNCGSDAPVLAEVCDGTVERSDEVGPRRVTEAADVLHPVEQKVRHRARPKGEHRGALTR